MTGILLSAASCSCVVSAVPSIEAIDQQLGALGDLVLDLVDLGRDVVLRVLQVDVVAELLQRGLDVVAVVDPALGGLRRHGDADQAARGGAPEAPAAGPGRRSSRSIRRRPGPTASAMLPATVARRASFMFSPSSDRPSVDRGADCRRSGQLERSGRGRAGSRPGSSGCGRRTPTGCVSASISSSSVRIISAKSRRVSGATSPVSTVWCGPPAVSHSSAEVDSDGAGFQTARATGSFGSGSSGRDDLDLVGHQPEPVAQVDDARSRWPGRGRRRRPAGPGPPGRRCPAGGSRTRGCPPRWSGRPPACARRGSSARPGRSGRCSPP